MNTLEKVSYELSLIGIDNKILNKAGCVKLLCSFDKLFIFGNEISKIIIDNNCLNVAFGEKITEPRIYIYECKE